MQKPSPYEGRPYLSASYTVNNYLLQPVTSGKDGFFVDRKTQDAVIRNLEIIGEATKRLSASLKNAHPDIAWKPIAGMRDNWCMITSA